MSMELESQMVHGVRRSWQRDSKRPGLNTFMSMVEMDGRLRKENAQLLKEFAIECPDKRACIETAFLLYAHKNKGTEKAALAKRIVSTIRAVAMLEMLSL